MIGNEIIIGVTPNGGIPVILQLHTVFGTTCLVPALFYRARHEQCTVSILYAPMDDEPYDQNDLRTAVTFGNDEVIREWVTRQKDKARVTRWVLFPAALYGQLAILKTHLNHGDDKAKDCSDMYQGWSIYHHAVKGLEMNHPMGNEPTAAIKVLRTQLDIIHVLGCSKVPLSNQDDEIESPSQMALDCGFHEASILLDIIAVINSETVPTPGLDGINMTSSLGSHIVHKKALFSLVEWAYESSNKDIMSFIHERYISLTSDLLTPRNQSPLFLRAVRSQRMDVMELVLNPQSKRSASDRIFSQAYVYDLGNDEPVNASAISLACQLCLEGIPFLLKKLLEYPLTSPFCQHLSLGDLGLRLVPVELFHENLISLTLSRNYLSKLPPVEKWRCRDLQQLNLAENKFKELPKALFQLPNLRDFNVSDNQLTTLDPCFWTAPCLRNLNVSSNLLKQLPCPVRPQEPKEDVSDRGEDVGFIRSQLGTEAPEIQYSVRHEFIDIDFERDKGYRKTQGGHRLEILDASSNQLTSIPEGLPCLAPMLLTLRLSKNKISNFSFVSDYPPGLKSLDLSNNGANVCISSTKAGSTPTCFQTLVLEPHISRKCSHSDHNSLHSLQYLNISRNKLKTLVIEDSSLSLSVSVSQGLAGMQATLHTSPTHKEAKQHEGTLFPKLQTLLVGKNNLIEVPEALHKLDQLASLDISDNESITRLPSSLSHLNLYSFNYSGISDPIVNEFRSSQKAWEVLYYLRTRETGVITNASMRLFVIGHFEKGKTSVLNALQTIGRSRTGSLFSGGSADRESTQLLRSTIGIECSKWVCTKRRAQTKITFHTWDFAGQMDYYATHQCFLSNRALYLLVWKLTDEEKGIESLRVWLKNLQSLAPEASVIIVGTHYDALKKTVNKGTIEQLLAKYHSQIDKKYGVTSSFSGKGAPVIKGIHFVSCTDKTMFTGPTGIDHLNDSIYDVAMEMEAPRGNQPVGYHMRILDEKIPDSYLRLQDYIAHLIEDDNPRNPNYVVKKSEFCNREEVREIVGSPKEVEAAMNFLHNNRGVVLYFMKPKLEDYYILNPQWWFDACALVTSHDNVASLVTPGSELTTGLLKIKLVLDRFREKAYTPEQIPLISFFLLEFGVLMRVDKEMVLLPSMIRPAPTIKLGAESGVFPWGNFSVEDVRVMDSINVMAAEADLRSMPSELKVQRTGLIYRRMLIVPSLPSGFWSKLICLCLQKDDFMYIVGEICRDSPTRIGVNCSIRIIGTSTLSLTYWKTGLVFCLDETLLLRINSMYDDEFIDPMKRATISDTRSKVSHFYQQCDGKERPLLDTSLSDVIEILVPEVQLLTARSFDKTMSTKLLAKALEIVDEVLKGHCDMLTDDGIYTMDAMNHVVPCPICFGDKDNRPPLPPYHPEGRSPEQRSRVTSESHHHRFQQAAQRQRVTTPTKRSPLSRKPPIGSIVVFPVDQCIKASLSGKFIYCPTHNHLNIERLTPDLLFNDMAEVKLSRGDLKDPKGCDGSPIGSGCYGVVYHKILKPPNLEEIPQEFLEDIKDSENVQDVHVAVKEFKALEGENDMTTDLMKTYSDMRYELNKLNMLHHRYVVKFVGLLTHPRSFVLEWAPMMSLDSIRKAHSQSDGNNYLCPCSLYLVLMQVTDGLAYLHRPPVGIVHNDLKLSNILAYKFPPLGHTCCSDSLDRGRCEVALSDVEDCGVLVKLGDLGVSTNPGSHSTRSLVGLKRLTPECIMFKAHLTEKVDIFCLASCLFELMTLRGLPPHGMSEQDFKTMIQKGDRPQFHINDPSYPLPLYLCLGQCWQQEHSRRPSAVKLKQFLSQVTGVSPSNHFQIKNRNMDQLLESFMFPEGSVSAVHVNPKNLVICLAIKQFQRSQTGSTRVLLAEYQEQAGGTHGVLKTYLVQHVLETLKAVHVTNDMEVIMGCENGDLMIVSKNAIPQRICRSRQCKLSSKNHGSLVYMHYIEKICTLVMGFDSGLIHVLRINDMSNLSDAFTSGFCGPVDNNQHTNSFLAVHLTSNSDSPPPPSTIVMEIWCGQDQNTIAVWQFSERDRSNQWRGIHPTQSIVPMRHNTYTSPLSSVTKMVTSMDGKWVYCLVTDWMRAGALCLIDVARQKQPHFLQCSNCVTTLSVTINKQENKQEDQLEGKLLLGTADGLVQIYTISAKNPVPSKHKQLMCHSGPVHTVSLSEGHITSEGYTSLFRTYLGRQSEQIPCSYLITVGNGCVDINSVDERETGGGGGKKYCCINAWLV